MPDRESSGAPLVGFVLGVAMLALGAIPIGLVILGGERLSNLIYPPFWMYYGLVAAGLVFIWLYFHWRAEVTGGGAETR